MMHLKIHDRKKVWQNGIFALLMALTAGFLFWKCQYGITSVDEGLYLTIPYRLVKGDGLFVHEWHLSQMSGLLTLPLVWLYMTVNGGTDGLVLFMRYATTFVQCLIAVLVYLRLRRHSYIGAVAASLVFALYIPFGIMQLSYNSMGIMTMVLCGVLLLPGKKERKSLYVLAGLSFAAAVLCCPYLLIVYAVYLISVAVVAWQHRSEKDKPLSPWSIKGAVLLSVGAAIAAALFAVFVLSRGSLGNIVKAFRYILDDPEHPSRGIVTLIVSYVRGILDATAISKWLYGALALLLIACIADRKRKNRRLVYFCASAVITAVLMFSLFYRLRYINYVMWGINMMGPILLLLTNRSMVRRVFALLWVPGMLYSFCIHLSSNQIFITAASASAVATVGTVMMLGLFAGELWQSHPSVSQRSFSAAAAGLLAVLQLLPLGYMRYRSVFWDETCMSAPTHVLTEGVQSGLRTSGERYSYYTNSEKLLNYVRSCAPEKVLYLSYSTWYYLEGDYEMSAYSSWLAGSDGHTVNRLNAYYELNPDKLPDLVFIDSEFLDAGLAFVKAHGYEQTKVPSIWVLPEGIKP